MKRTTSLGEMEPGLQILEAQVRRDLDCIAHPSMPWLVPKTAPDGSAALDVLIVGRRAIRRGDRLRPAAGQGGQHPGPGPGAARPRRPLAKLRPHADSAKPEGVHRPRPGHPQPDLPVMARGAIRPGILGVPGPDPAGALGGLPAVGARRDRRPGPERRPRDRHRPSRPRAAGRDRRAGRRGPHPSLPQAGAGHRAGRRGTLVDAGLHSRLAPAPARPHRRSHRVRRPARQGRGGPRHRRIVARQCGDGAGGGRGQRPFVLPPGPSATGPALPVADLRRFFSATSRTWTIRGAGAS